MKYTPSLFGILLLVLIILLLHFLYIPCSSSSRSLCLRTPRFSFAISFILRYSFHHTRSHFSPPPFASGDSAGNGESLLLLIPSLQETPLRRKKFTLHYLSTPYAESLLHSFSRFRRFRWEGGTPRFLFHHFIYSLTFIFTLRGVPAPLILSLQETPLGMGVGIWSQRSPWSVNFFCLATIWYKTIRFYNGIK